MPRIFDNIGEKLLPALQTTLDVSDRADFCVGYFNLRGWRQLDSRIEQWSGEDGQCCRLLVGMQTLPHDELRHSLSFVSEGLGLDNQAVVRLKKKLAEEFRDQIAMGVPTNEDEAGLRRLANQIRSRKVQVKLFLRHPLHAKLYLLFRQDYNNPITGFLGSSNLTLPGLSSQGELNIDVTDRDACEKLAQWFEDRWNDRWCLDISDELIQIIDESWAGENEIPPYHIYLKMAYHLSQEARAGLSEFRLPREFGEKLFEFQKAAVKIAAHHLNKRGGVLVADVVGLGKTLTACAIARIFQDDHFLETLVICPKNLVKMWQDHVEHYRMIARVLPISTAINSLPDLRRYRVIIIDESHNLRNRETKTYHALYDYIFKNDSKCILLTATPYNKTYLDLSSQLRLFVPEDADLGVRPERKLQEPGGEVEFVRRHQCPVRSLSAFEKSDYTEDWQELMRLFMVRRTRSFIQKNYAEVDPDNGRTYLTMEDGKRSYFPVRKPKTAKFTVNDADPSDQYARLYAPFVVNAVASLELPRYGLGNYIAQNPEEPPTAREEKGIRDLGRAGKRLMGFCRTNLFKRLESGGLTFLQSVNRHILRNHVFIHAIENDLPLPIGTQYIELFDTRLKDEDSDACTYSLMNGDEEYSCDIHEANSVVYSEELYRKRAAEIYGEYAGPRKRQFHWLRPSLFVADLRDSLRRDAKTLLSVLDNCGDWIPDSDAKLEALFKLLTVTHPSEKVLVFTQFADTVRYLDAELNKRGVTAMEGVTGDSADPTGSAWRFSPNSNEKRDKVKPEDELRVLIATDVLSEGQNLQDCNIVVNYDLPWAIIRLIQRAGRVDRIGQEAEEILCYSFVPADGVERLIRLRARVRQRLRENAEVVGTDEAFFEDDMTEKQLRDIFTEKSGLMDEQEDDDVDLASYAYQIWKNAVDRDPKLAGIIPDMPNVTYSAKAHKATPKSPHGVLVYMRTAEDNDALAWMDENGNSITQSQLAILRAAECLPDTPAIPRHERHHELVKAGVEHLVKEEKSVGGQLGRPSGARFKTYERLKRHAGEVKGTIWDTPELEKALDDIYRYPLKQTATDTLNRIIKSGVTDDILADVVINLRNEDKLCMVQEEAERHEPKLICSLGLFEAEGGR
ncbi:MAG TPA: helicase-related protein [Armatimonadota bacterium]|nr:helicase-related protein [Armatimonadota bacterium]